MSRLGTRSVQRIRGDEGHLLLIWPQLSSMINLQNFRYYFKRYTTPHYIDETNLHNKLKFKEEMYLEGHSDVIYIRFKVTKALTIHRMHIF